MKKSGEKLNSFAVHSLFVVMIVIGIYFIISSSASITGNVVLDAQTAKSQFENTLSSSAMFNQISQGSMCIVINDPAQPLSLQAVKTSTGWTVSEMVGFCTGINAEDVVVQFSDYSSFLDIVNNPSPKNIAKGAMNRDFEILESKFVELGGNVICDETFKEQYCTALKLTAPSTDLIDGDLSCCIDDLSRSEKKLLEQHLQDGDFTDETGVVETAGVISGLSMNLILMLVLGLFVVIIIVVVSVMMRGKSDLSGQIKPAKMGVGSDAAVTGVPVIPVLSGQAIHPPEAEPRTTPAKELVDLQNYVNQAMKQGYSAEDICTHLLEIGWDKATSDSVVENAQKNLTQSQ